MSDKLWKATERAIAQRLGGQRLGAVGIAGPDVVTDSLAIEVKQRKRLPAWLSGAMEQAVGAASGERIPVVVLHETGQRHDSDFVILRLADFQARLGGLETAT